MFELSHKSHLQNGCFYAKEFPVEKSEIISPPRYADDFISSKIPIPRIVKQKLKYHFTGCVTICRLAICDESVNSQIACWYYSTAVLIYRDRKKTVKGNQRNLVAVKEKKANQQ